MVVRDSVLGENVEITIDLSNESVFRPNVRGFENIQYLLNLDVEKWLNDNTEAWWLEHASKLWDDIGYLQIWFRYRDIQTNTILPIIGPAKFYFHNRNDALMFKLTWGGK